MSTSNIALQAQDITKTYRMGENKVSALKGVSLTVLRGEFVAITGASGSGKSTFMHILGCLDVPTSGELYIDGKNVAHMTRDEQARIRNQKIGFVFQRFHLLADLTALDNVALPLLYAGKSEQTARLRAQELLESVGLSHRLYNYPSQLSGGQQQRVAIARALANNPSIILADEPTGNLDTETGTVIMGLLKTLNDEKQVTIILVTHEPDISTQTKRIIELRDGKVKNDTLLG